MLTHNSNGRIFTLILVAEGVQWFLGAGVLLSTCKQTYSAIRVVLLTCSFRHSALTVSLSARFDLFASAGTGVVFGVT